MWTAISVGIICGTVLILGIKCITSLSILLKLRINTDFKKTKYTNDTRLKIEEPVRPITLNDEMVSEIAAIKTQLTGLSMAKGMRGINGK